MEIEILKALRPQFGVEIYPWGASFKQIKPNPGTRQTARRRPWGYLLLEKIKDKRQAKNFLEGKFYYLLYRSYKTGREKENRSILKGRSPPLWLERTKKGEKPFFGFPPSLQIVLKF